MLDDISVLLILIIRAVRFDDAVDAVNGAGDAVSGDEFGKVTAYGLQRFSSYTPKAALREKARTHRSKKSTEMPKSLAILPSPTTR